MLGGVGGEGVDIFPMLGMCVVRAWWSLWLASVVVMVASLRWECAEGGSRRRQWSRGELLGL